jgi:hypothetical protein
MNILSEDLADIHDEWGWRKCDNCIIGRLVGWGIMRWRKILVIIQTIGWVVIIMVMNGVTGRVPIGAIITGVSNQVSARYRIAPN